MINDQQGLAAIVVVVTIGFGTVAALIFMSVGQASRLQNDLLAENLTLARRFARSCAINVTLDLLSEPRRKEPKEFLELPTACRSCFKPDTETSGLLLVHANAGGAQAVAKVNVNIVAEKPMGKLQFLTVDKFVCP